MKPPPNKAPAALPSLASGNGEPAHGTRTLELSRPRHSGINTRSLPSSLLPRSSSIPAFDPGKGASSASSHASLRVERQLEPANVSLRPEAGSLGRVLLIDDTEAVLQRLEARLRAVGYDVIASSQPVGLARHVPYCDVVIIDYHMPGVNGGEVLRSLKSLALRSGAGPLFFIYTGDKTISIEFRRLGFDGAFINKGDDESLVQQLEVALRLSKLRRRQR